MRRPIRISWLRWSLTVALLASLALQAGPAETDGQSVCSDHLLAVAPQQVGRPLTDNTIRLVDMSGTEVETVPFEQPGQIFPTSTPGVRLIRSLGGNYALLERDTQTVTPLVFAGASLGSVVHDSFQFVDSQGQRFALFGDPGSLQAWIVDLTTGETLPISDLIDKTAFPVLSAAIDRNDTLLTFTNGRSAYAIALEAASSPIPIDSAPVNAITPTENGQAVLYQRSSGEKDSELIRFDLESGEREVITTGSDGMIFRVFPGDRLAYSDAGTVWWLEPDGLSARIVGEFGSAARPVAMATDGSSLLVWNDADGIDEWSVANLVTGLVTKLPQLDGMQRIDRLPSGEFSLFTAADNRAPGTPGTTYVSLHLASGIASLLLVQDGADIYTVAPSASASGRFHLIQAINPALGRLWLTDSEIGTTTLLATSSGAAAGLVTIDDCAIAVSIFDTVGEGRQGTVTISNLTTGATSATIPDAILLGWAS